MQRKSNKHLCLVKRTHTKFCICVWASKDHINFLNWKSSYRKKHVMNPCKWLVNSYHFPFSCKTRACIFQRKSIYFEKWFKTYKIYIYLGICNIYKQFMESHVNFCYHLFMRKMSLIYSFLLFKTIVSVCKNYLKIKVA